MTVVTVSPNYQVVIPKDVRERLNIRPGPKVEAFALGSRIELVPLEAAPTHGTVRVGRGRGGHRPTCPICTWPPPRRAPKLGSHFSTATRRP